MVHPGRPVPLLHALVLRRLHPRKAAPQGRQAAAQVPPRKFSHIHTTSTLLTFKPAVPRRLERAQALRPNPPEPLHLLLDAEPVSAAPRRRTLPAAPGRLVARAAPHVQRHRRPAPVLCAAAPRRDQDEPQPAGRPADGDAAVWSAAAADGGAPGPPAERRYR